MDHINETLYMFSESYISIEFSNKKIKNGQRTINLS